MGTGDRTRGVLSGAPWCTAVVLVLGCWLAAAPAAADVLPGVARTATDQVAATAGDATTVAVQTVADTTSAGPPVTPALPPAVEQVPAQVERVVRRVTDTAGAAAPPVVPAAVNDAVRRSAPPAAETVRHAVPPARADGRPATPANTSGQPAPARGERASSAARADARPANDRTPAIHAARPALEAPQLEGAASTASSPASPLPWLSGPDAVIPTDVPTFAPGPDRDADGQPAAPDGQSGGLAGTFASGLSGGSFFFFGGMALLAAVLSLAGPALRRRLLMRPAMGWPGAFIPLLERPG
jgi:hypothetical protein